MVRAKFVYSGYESSQTTAKIDSAGLWTPDHMHLIEIRTLKFRPVYGNDDPQHENTKFFVATPSGQVELGSVRPEVWAAFELGKEYYLDFTPA